MPSKFSFPSPSCLLVFLLGLLFFASPSVWAEKEDSEPSIKSSVEFSPQSKFLEGLEPLKKSEPLAVYLLTVDPGLGFRLFWSWWGHTAILVIDQEKDFELVFDYGLFEDIGPAFLYHYLIGKPNFVLGIDSLKNTLWRYQVQKRRVYAQRLYAKESRIRSFYQRLLWNAQPQNRSYVYHHYHDNCTTKPRDLIDRFFFNASLSKKYSQIEEEKSIRELVLEPAYSIPPIFAAFSLVVGYKIDQRRSSWEGMFLPQRLMQRLEQYRINRAKEKSKVIGQTRLLSPPSLLPYQKRLPSSASVYLSWLFFIFSILLFLFVFYLYPVLYPNKKFSLLLARLGWYFCFLVLGLLGFLINYIYFIQSVSPFGFETIGYNFSLHALHPFLLILPLALPFCRKKKPKLWFSLHRLILLFLEIGSVLALFLALYALPFLLIVLCMQRLILIQVKRGLL